MASPRKDRSHGRTLDLARLDDDDLLGRRMCDLGLRIEGTPLESWIAILDEELDRRDLVFRPRVWLSDEWFMPPDAPGIGAPFYLAHPRLMKLERRMMFDVEGGTQREGLRLLRHECGHAIQYAYRLHRRKRWRELFGSSAQPYPEAYRPKPLSRDHVQHLDNHYAQAHPDEDFAETFAVWLTPRATWRRRYAHWPALAKLEYVDELMATIAGERPPVTSRKRIRPLSSLRMTLRTHYERRQSQYGIEDADVYNRDLRRLFAEREPGDRRPSAAGALRRWRRELLEVVARWTGLYPYTINGIYEEMIDRCGVLGLRVPTDIDEATLKRDAAVLLTVQATAHLHRGGQWITV